MSVHVLPWARTPDPDPGLPWLQCAREFRAVPQGEVERARVWRSFAANVHGPRERALAKVWARYFRGAAKRTAERAVDVLGPRMKNISDAELIAILFEREEAKFAYETIGESTIRAILQTGFRSVAIEVAGLTWDSVTDPSSQVLGRYIVEVSKWTRDRVQAIVRNALTNGWSIAQMQAQIMGDVAFSPVRALRVARTETTNAIGKGSSLAYQDAAKQGVDLQRQWLSARDAAVRESHVALDGQIVDVGQPYVIPSGENAGAEGMHPGDFSAAAEVVNCRCTEIPVVRA